MPRAPGFLRFFDSRVGRALRDHELLQDGDRILVASLCERDALPLFDWLQQRSTRPPFRFSLRVALLHPPGQGVPTEWRQAWVRVASEADTPLHELAFPGLQGGRCHACRAQGLHLCARLAEETACTAVALADNLDNLAEDVLNGLVQAGELRRTSPREELDSGLRLLRPFATTEARLVRRYARERGLPDGPGACPQGDPARRVRLPDVLEALGGKPTRIKFNLARAARHVPVVTPSGSR